ncbi:MAG TPA: bifunctional [glutamate--ammonia ligase]-adenylyl-L-tyrosine phosphorylase/[glutamate--ammonia-ligase] adenylyltransferase [Candidatus Acidoferrum sp.]|nr:bifunctional [glutamate--ammonia ligase]-adenylyl-L-tyrosine phosphorylase/[glutamate--ammonia-ligase] adenylyltransferase [Candidatus Acidoferrum sp.]
MEERIWKHSIARSAVPERARRAFDELRSASQQIEKADAETARIWCALWSGSEWAVELLRKHPEWLEHLTAEALAYLHQLKGLQRELEMFLTSDLESGRHAQAFAKLRQFKQREMIRIAARDLARLARTPEIIGEISAVADACLATVLRIVTHQATLRFGMPFEQDASGEWQQAKFCVLGMGKLGGQELNYSSDVDVLFVYSDEGSVFKEPPRKGKTTKSSLTNHQFFTRVAEAFINEVGKLTPDGMLFRIDLRLRPEGDAGPLVRSLASYENYYAQWGQTWERMMLIKARRVAGDATLAGEFLEMVQPFRYPRSVNEKALDEVAAMKLRIENEVLKSGEMDRNVKLGRGGIREIEFIAQSMQLLHAGRNPFLQGAQTLPVLEKLVQYQILTGPDAAGLSAAYQFLRDVEHRLQMEQNRQTHSLPISPAARERIASVMGFKSFAAFDKVRAKHSRHVRTVYEKLLKTNGRVEAETLPNDFDESAANRWQNVLAEHSFRDPAHAFRLLKEFALGPGFGHVSGRTTELALQLIPKILAFCPVKNPRKITSSSSHSRLTGEILSDPDRVVARIDSFVSAYGARATLYEMWTSNPALFELMLFLFDRSEFLAEVAIRTPDLVDELVLSGHLQRRKEAEQIFEELQHGRGDADQKLWLRRYHQSELMRIGLRDILGLADHEQNFDELTALADASLRYALEIVQRKRKLRAPPFAIIGWGKLGGREINYGSDLDITFVAAPKVKNLPALQPLAAEVMDLLSSQTELGVAFQTDTRLRPDGEKGLLVNTITAYEDYYRQRAMLWEIQSLTRTRIVAGDKKVGEAFHEISAQLTDFGTKPKINAFTPDWKKQIAHMRERIEKERTPAGKDALAIKTGRGGLIDAEFLAQVFSLEYGWSEPNTLRALQRAASEGILTKADAEKLVENYRKLRRIEAILRRWSFAGETVLPDDPAPLYRVAVRCGWKDSDEFMKALAMYRVAIRDVYGRVMR